MSFEKYAAGADLARYSGITFRVETDTVMCQRKEL